MNDKSLIKIVLMILLTLITIVQPANANSSSISPTNNFSFIFFTDPHVGSGLGNKYTPIAVNDILENYSNADFIVNGGDITELGMPNQYQEYIQMMKPLTMPIFQTLGNHESRWSDAGKDLFLRNIGVPYKSWDHKGVHFVILDTSIARGQHGHLEKQMLKWLEQDLIKVGKIKPIIVFSHHPIFFDEAKDESKFMDNDWSLWNVIKDYNVSAIFTGHGHRDDIWKVNGIPVFMTKAVMGDGYAVIEINEQKQELTVTNRTPSQKTGKLFATVALAKQNNKPEVRIVSPIQDQIQTTNFDLKVSLQNWLSIPQRVEYKLEDNKWKYMELVNNEYIKNIDITQFDDGIRNIWVRAVDNEGKVFLDRVQFRIAQNEQVSIKWEVATDGGVQSSPVVYGNKVIVGDNNGKLYAFEQSTGRKIWEFKTEGAIIDAPTINDEKVYFGSTDGKVYCLNIYNGKKLWEYLTGGAVVAQPLVAEGKVFVGSADFYMYALEANSGNFIWKFATSNLINSKAAYGQELLFFGSWDRYFYAVNAKTGELKWKKEIGSQIYYAPAVSNPLYYNNKVIISTPGSIIYAFEASNGNQIWEIKESSGLSTPMIFNKAVVYSNLSGLIYALDPDTGEKVWQAKSGLAGYISSPVAHGGNIVIGGLNGKIGSVNTGENPVNWAIKLGETYLFNKVATSGNMIFAGTLEGKVFGITAEPGMLPKPFSMGDAFNDISDHWARKQLNSLAKLGLIQGYSDGSFKPYEPINRAQLAVVLSRHLKYEQPSEVFQTNLIDIKNYWAAQNIAAMQEKGVVSGYQDLKGKYYFKPENNVKRAEAVVMLARSLNLTKPTDGFKTKLTDISDHWAKDYIMALEEKGIISGYEENGKLLFNPEKEINRGEMGVILVRSVNFSA